jgi:hypothetical protein
MKTKTIVFTLAAIAFIFSGCAYFTKTTPPKNTGTPTTPSVTLTEAEAQIIAEKTCIKGGESLAPGYYNEGTKTWWFDANLNATREGCNPACVVSEETKTAEINWRCTGLITPTEPTAKCGIENCHGMDIACGPNVAEICTEIYMAGDNCRQFASCQNTDGECKLVKSAKFDACKTCVEKCTADTTDNPTDFFQCESKCTK